MAKYKPGDQFTIEVEEIVHEDRFGDAVYSISNIDRRMTEEDLDVLIYAMVRTSKITKKEVAYNLGYADGVVAENERIRNVLFPFEEE